MLAFINCREFIKYSNLPIVKAKSSTAVQKIKALRKRHVHQSSFALQNFSSVLSNTYLFSQPLQQEISRL
jgi:hypothetical protein